MTERLLGTMLEISASVSAVVLFAFLLTPLLKKRFTAKWRYWLWLVLAVRLLVPVNFHAPQPAVRIPVPQKAVAVQSVPTVSPVRGQVVNAAVSPKKAPEKASAEAPAKAADTARPIPVSRLIAVIWLAGAAIFLLSRFAAYFVFLRGVRRWSFPIRDEKTREILRSQKAELGIRRGTAFLCCKKINSPMMAGFFRPMLLLPETAYSEEDLRLILKHELIHWKRRDVWYKLLLCAANAVHWFNPVVWLMAHRAGEDTELVCDSEVVKGFGIENRRQYGKAILSSVRRGRIRGAAFSTYFSGNAEALKRRFANILDGGRKKKGVAAFCAALAGIVVIGSLVACTGTGSASPGRIDSSAPPPDSGSSSQAESSRVASSAGGSEAACRDMTITGRTLCGDFGTVVCGALKSDPKQGVAVVLWNGGEVQSTRYLTPEKHGAIRPDVTDNSHGAKEDVFSVTAEDGYTWLFNMYNGFEMGKPGGSDAQASSRPSESGSVLNQIKAALNTKVPLMLPTSVPVKQNRHLTAKTSSQEENYKVDFYETDQPVKINSQAASKGTPVATLEAAGYRDAASAKEDVSGYAKINPADYDEFADLGHQIRAVRQAGLGHQQLLWNEGNWYVHLDFPTDSTLQNKAYPDNMQLAKDVAACLSKSILPVPREIGAITIMNWNTSVGTTVEWQDGSSVYRISSGDPMTALNIAAAMKLE